MLNLHCKFGILQLAFLFPYPIAEPQVLPPPKDRSFSLNESRNLQLRIFSQLAVFHFLFPSTNEELSFEILK